MNSTRRDLLQTGAAVALATAAYPLPARAQERGTLRVTAASSDLNAMWRELVRAYQEAHPGITINFDNSTRSYDDLVQATLRAAITNALPDVSFQGANRVRVFVDRGLAIPLDPFLSADAGAGRQAFSPSVAAIGRLQEKTYALGFGVAVPVVFYNLDLVRQAGGAPSSTPSDWSEILGLANRVQALGGDKLGAYFQYDSADWLWIALIQSQGGRLMTPDERRVAFDGPEGLRALEVLRQFGQAGQSRVDMSRDQARQLFAAGSMGMIIDSNSNLPSFERASSGRFELAVGRFPVTSGTGRLPAAGSVSMMFATDPKQQRLAWNFLRFASGSAGQKIVGTQSGWLPANEHAAQAPEVLGNFYAASPRTKPSLDQVPLLNGWYAFPGENAVKITKALVDHMRMVVTLKELPEQALVAMAREVTTLLPAA